MSLPNTPPTENIVFQSRLSNVSPKLIAERMRAAVMQENYRHTSERPDRALLSHDEMMLYFEAIATLFYNIRKAKSTTDIVIASTTFYSVTTGKSATGSFLRMVDQLAVDVANDLPFFQSGNSWVEVCDELYKNVHRVKDSVLGAKIIRVFNHLVAHTFYAKMGIEIDSELFSKLEKKKIRPTVWNVLGFVDAIVGLLLFLARAGRQAMLTGSIDSFFVDSSIVTAWLDSASKLRKHAEFLGNPAAVGLSLPDYLQTLKVCMESGESLLKVFKKADEHRIIHSVLLELDVVNKRLTASMLAASFRWCPVAVLLYGDSGVAKSFIGTGLFNHYCAIRGIKDGRLWTYNEKDEFYSGYKSYFVGVLYDDAGKFRSNKVMGIDPTIYDIIAAVNNIAFITNQADLPDKGKIPFLSEWVGVTTNVGDLNADQYFNCSAAFLRRFVCRITPIVKPAFRVEGQTKIDSSKIPGGEQYPDCWTFEVSYPVATKSTDGSEKGHFVKRLECANYGELLVHMTGVYERHIENQTKLLKTVGTMGPEAVCACGLPKSLCKCVELVEQEAFRPEVIVTPFDDIPAFDSADEDDVDLLVDQAFAMEAQADVQMDASGMKFQMRTKRTKLLMSLRSELLKKYKGVKGADAIYYRQLWEEDYAKLVDANVDDNVDRTPEKCVQFVKKDILAKMKEFQALTPVEKLNEITESAFDFEEDKNDFLSFKPRIGQRCFYVQTQLNNLKEKILTFVGPALSDSEMLLLDTYIYERVPQYVADGWPLGDIIRGAMDYIKFYGNAVEDPVRLHTREYLLTDRGETSFIENAGIWCFRQYFERKWVFNTFNFFAKSSMIRSCALYFVPKKRQLGVGQTLINAGTAYDLKLLGNNKYVLLVIFVCSAVSSYAIVYTFLKKIGFGIHAKPAVPSHVGSFDAGEYGDGASTEFSVEPQMDLNGVGRKPTVRESERKNVWVVPERTITKFDVDSRRPQDVQQCFNAVRKNLRYAELKWKDENDVAFTAITRVLLIDSETIVLNNHCMKDGCKMNIWFGPKTGVGAQPAVVVDILESMLTRMPERDICIIKTMALPCLVKKITHLFPKKTFQSVGPACYFMMQENGEIEQRSAFGLKQRYLGGFVGAGEASFEAWTCHPEKPTVYGDCGSVLVVQSPLGAVILGIHCAYAADNNRAWATPLFYEDFDDKKIVTMGVLLPARPLAQVKVIGGEYFLEKEDKLFTDYHKEGKMITHGQLQGFRPRMKATGVKTGCAEYVLSRGEEFSPPITDRLFRPLMGAWEQPQNILKNYLSPTHDMREDVWSACVEAFTKHVGDNLTQEDWDDIHPVPLDVAVNGFPGVPNVDAQKFTTSAGHGHTGAKIQFLSEPEAHFEWTHFRKYSDVIHSEVDKMREDAREGIRPHAIYTTTLKDEMLALRKILAGKTRGFHVCPTAFLTNMRMSTMALCRVMIRRRKLFGIAVGLNTHSEEWDDMIKEAMRLLGNNWAAGDFQAFEAILSLLISNGTAKVFLKLAERSGNFSEDEMMIFRTLLADTTNPTLDFFGTLITLLGGEASGHQLTTFFNCIANQLLHMYAWVVIKVVLSGKRFEDCDLVAIALEWFEWVCRNTLGDDVWLKVHEAHGYYNHTSIQAVFEPMGIVYTMADKTAASIPYIGLEEVSFLKRTSVRHSCFPDMYVAALEKESIYKMLLYTIPSDSVSKEEQLAAAFCSAQAEAFFHDKVFFDQVWDLIEKAPKNDELRFRMEENPRPSWFRMVRRFVEASPKLKALQLVPAIEESETSETKHSYCHVNDIELQTSWSVDAWGSTAMERSSEVCIYRGVKQSPKKVHKSRRTKEDPDSDNRFLTKNFLKKTETVFGDDTEMTRATDKSVIEKVDIKIHKKEAKKQKRNRWAKRPVAQSDVTMDLGVESAMSGSSDQHQETVTFVNEPESVHVNMGTAATQIVKEMNMPQGIATYLSRPLLIESYSWVENTADGPKNDFYPWQAFFTNPKMADKLQGYSLLNAKLHLKFLINGSPFYYGAMMCNYTPLNGHRDDTARGGAFLGNELVLESQKPHIWLNNQDCSSAEMTLPFLFPYPYIELTSDQLASMGIVRMIQYAPLLSANGTSSSTVTIQVYAWAEDVHLAGPTDQPVAQSGFRPNKQISGPASAIANAAGSLKSVPIIGAYAMATEKIARTVGAVAGFFGFTNVPVIEDVKPFKPIPFQLASSEISEPVMKLSLQPKQEIALGSEHYGGPSEDELALSSFTQRTSFVVGSDWPTTLTTGVPLFTTGVTPLMCQNDLTTAQWAWTPMGYLGQMFQYWRGTIRFTFKVIRSPYHRGRLQISWDRAANDWNQRPDLGNPNTYSVIMDLDETDVVTMDIPYSQAKQFLEVMHYYSVPRVPWSTDASPAGVVDGEMNGILSVSVLNRLTAPEASSSVRLLVFVSAGEDFEYAAPSDAHRQDINTLTSFSLYRAPPAFAGVEAQSKFTEDVSATSLSSPNVAPDVYKEVFGEKIASLRELLHRSSASRFHYFGATENLAGTAEFVIPFKHIPPPPGPYVEGWDTATIGLISQPFFQTRLHPILLIGNCFLGYKGSVNVAANVEMSNVAPTSTNYDHVSIQRKKYGSISITAERQPSVVNMGGTASTQIKLANIGLSSGTTGMALTNTRTNAGLVANLPHYSNAGFNMFDLYKMYSNQDNFTDGNNDWYNLRVKKPHPTGTSSMQNALVTLYWGSGPDFDLVFFINCPLMNLVTTV